MRFIPASLRVMVSVRISQFNLLAVYGAVVE
jgi:hypothetical protein